MTQAPGNAPDMLTRREWLIAGTVIACASRSVSTAVAQDNLSDTVVPIVCGQIGTTHAHAAGKLSAMLGQPQNWNVAGWSEPDPQRRSAVADRKPYSEAPAMSEAELLAVPDLAAVAVETDFDQATQTALRAIQAGKHVHLDKPGGVDHVAFSQMRRAAEAAGLTVQMGYMLRYNPAFELLIQAVREGWLGEITEVDAAMGKLADPATRRQLVLQPGGAMFEIGCHLIDIVVTLLGEPTHVETFSTPSADDGVPDNQLAVLVYPRATANVRANFTDPFGGPRRRFNVTGTQGSFEIAPLESGVVQLSLTRAVGDFEQGRRTVRLDLVGGRYDGEFTDLARVIRGEKRLAWDAAHDIAVHATTLRAAGIWNPL